MSTLRVTRIAACPVGQAPAFVEQFFAERRTGDGPATLALRAPLAIPGWPEMELARDCIVRVDPAPLPGTMTKHYTVRWKSAGGGPFPQFDGTLELANDDDYTRTVLVLQGSYEPPLGPLGAGFDHLIGNAIARGTGDELLESIARYLEQRSRSVEAAKQNRRLTAGM